MKITRDKAQRKKVIAWLWVLVWMGLIFFFSSQPGEASASLSGGITRFFIDSIERVFPRLTIDWQALHLLIRKNAHFFVYGVLGLLVLRAILLSKPLTLKTYGLALLICVVYAALDETHQLFVPGRAGQIQDVLIDAAGAVSGSGLYALFFRHRTKKARRNP